MIQLTVELVKRRQLEDKTQNLIWGIIITVFFHRIRLDNLITIIALAAYSTKDKRACQKQY
tara:strand:- start:550 stop:732 length:183 start_codon:yes stop_codon:yes gene_type:complete